jgi:hypothetical protein
MNTKLPNLSTLPAGTPLLLRNGSVVYVSARKVDRDYLGPWILHAATLEKALDPACFKVSSAGATTGFYWGDSAQTCYQNNPRDVVGLAPGAIKTPNALDTLEARVAAMALELEALKAQVAGATPAPAPKPRLLDDRDPAPQDEIPVGWMMLNVGDFIHSHDLLEFQHHNAWASGLVGERVKRDGCKAYRHPSRFPSAGPAPLPAPKPVPSWAKVADGFNPRSLTEQQVGCAEGWRLLTHAELHACPSGCAVGWLCGEKGAEFLQLEDDTFNANGYLRNDGYTYRTKHPVGHFLPKPAPAPVPVAAMPAHQTEKGVSLEGVKAGTRVKLVDGTVLVVKALRQGDSSVVEFEGGKSAWKNCGRSNLTLKWADTIVAEILPDVLAPVVEKWIPKTGSYHVGASNQGFRARVSAGSPPSMQTNYASHGLSYPNREAAEEAAKRLAFWARLMALACELNGGSIGGPAAVMFHGRTNLWIEFPVRSENLAATGGLFKDLQTAKEAAEIMNRDGWQPVSKF